MRIIVPSAVLLLAAFTSVTRANETPQTFLTTHCIRCHGNLKQKADRRFDTLPSQIKSLDDLERYQEIVDQLNLQTMPPEGETQPTTDERARTIAHLTRQITSAHRALKTSGRHSVLRRLNSWEYRQTL